MYFYEVAPASRTYQGAELLTYQSDQPLLIGEIIVVKIRTTSVTAFVVRSVEKPTFKTSLIVEQLGLTITPEHLELFSWIRDYYPAPVGIHAQLFLPLSSTKDFQKQDLKDKPGAPDTATPPALTTDQSQAMKQLVDAAGTVLLHGDTGTGKTRLYIERAQQMLGVGRSVLVLVPEISLSPQLVKTFESYIDAPITLTHSNLTPAQRRHAWHQINQMDKPQIVIGPRSALFMPLRNIGLIVMDEFHESAYKQDQSPYYQSIRIASRLAHEHKAQLVLGSATPPISEFFVAEQKNIPIIRMTEKAISAPEKPVNTILVNLKDSNERTRSPLISRSLQKAIKETLDSGGQSLLFLNKRGSARVILCQNCGWHALCPNCDLPLTFHGDNFKLQCHTCGYITASPTSCPECKSADIIFKSPGTKAIVEAVQYLFPDARVARFDRDNLKAERLEARHSEIVAGDIDILIGTQLLAKGHDLPRLGLVGILLAENELQFPDYTSSERSYQLMHQLIGRVGRGHRSGTIVIQTYDPENLAVRTALRDMSWDEFYQQQLRERELFRFPPYYHLLKIEIARARHNTLEDSSRKIINFIRSSQLPVEVIGPTPSFTEKRNNMHHWQIIVKARQRSALTQIARGLPVKATINLDPSNLL